MIERLDHFMARASAAYYASHDPFRDFTTAPEVSQVFGEIVGLWAAVTWRLLGQPDPVSLVEAGPGRGTLMADALRAIAQVAPDFRAALHLHLIETSPRLRGIQAARLPGAEWHGDLTTVPAGPLLLLANEFLDALPVRQFVRVGDRWAERFVAGEAFVEQLLDPDGLPDMPGSLLDQVHDGSVLEHSETALAFVQAIAARLHDQPGAALLIDYGPEHSAPGESLQALRDGKPADPLSQPGSADVTAHVDFSRLVRAVRAAGADVHGPVPQGVFLTRLGLFRRVDRLARQQPPHRAAALLEAASRLAEPNRMGRLFKVLAICSPACPTPPGFEP